jgi:hypothetical protein
MTGTCGASERTGDGYGTSPPSTDPSERAAVTRDAPAFRAWKRTMSTNNRHSSAVVARAMSCLKLSSSATDRGCCCCTDAGAGNGAPGALVDTSVAIGAGWGGAGTARRCRSTFPERTLLDVDCGRCASGGGDGSDTAVVVGGDDPGERVAGGCGEELRSSSMGGCSTL